MNDKSKEAPAQDRSGRQFGSNMRETGQDAPGKKPEDVNERANAATIDPLDDTNNDPRVAEIRKQQDKEREDYVKNYKKPVAKKDADA